MGNQPSARLRLAQSPGSSDDDDDARYDHGSLHAPLGTSPTEPDATRLAAPAGARKLTVETRYDLAAAGARDESQRRASPTYNADVTNAGLLLAPDAPAPPNRRVEDLYDVQTQNIGRCVCSCYAVAERIRTTAHCSRTCTYMRLVEATTQW